MIFKFNLIATTSRGLERNASSELFALLREIGDGSPDIRTTGLRGLLLVKTSLQPTVVVEEVRKIIAQDPLRIRSIFRLIPIDAVVESDVEKILEATSSLVSRIGEGEAFRITVEKRRTNLSSSEIIRLIAGIINRPVNLEHPDWVVLIEIVGRSTGVAVLRPEHTLNIGKVIRREPPKGISV